MDKLKFILNNVSSQNMESKVMELKSILLVDYFDFFAQYIVTNRIATQENFHELYLDLILRLKNKDLERKVLKQSCNAVKALMGSEKIRVEIQERVLLKNLGNWIGLFTISRDIPLLHKDLSLKDILFQGYEEGKMIASVPFVSKVLGKGMISRFFKPPNPWVVSICRLLVEIYNLPNIKIFLKFDVEILHTTLNLNMAETVPTQLLKSRRVCMVPPIVDFDELPVDTQPKRSMFDNITFNPNIPFFNTPNFKKIVVHSISKAIQDNITYLIDNPVSVSSTTTKELILKDFAMEPDETKILRAASSMAQGLAAHLSGSAARDILRNAITQKIRIALTNNTRQPLPSYVEHAILTFVSENLELVCSVVQKAAVEASVQAVEQQLRQAIVDRKNHRERTGGRGQPYYDINFVGSSAYNIIMTLPESLRPRVVQPKQLQVYEEFFPGTRVKEQGNIGPSIATNPEKESGKSRATITQVPQNQELSLDQATSIIEKVVNDLVSLTNDSQGKPISPTDPTVGKIFSTIDPIMASPVRFDVAQYGVVLALVKIIDPLLCDVFIELLVNVVSVIPKMRVKITNLLTTTFAKNKQYQKTVPTLILCNIIDLPEYDVFLARNHVTINSEREDVEFLSTLLPTITAKFGSTQLMSSFSVTLREIKNISQSNNHVNTLFKFLKKNIKDLSFDGGLCYKAVQPTLQQKIVQLFNEWMTVYEKIDSPEKSYIQYIQQQKGFYGLKDFPNNENEFNYFRVTIEIALERCFKEEPEVKPNEDPTTEDKGPRLNYKPIDALSKLLSLIVKYFPEKVLILKRILYVIAGILERNYYNQPEQFDQRPYFRLFSNLLMEFNLPDPVFESNIRHILLEFQALFHKFRPSLFPGFSFAWLELISHRTFMPRLLKDSSQEGWVPMQELLLDLLQFLEPYLRSVQLNPSIRMLYKGTLRIFLVILHDFPQFFCEYHFHFCNVIPNSCIQLRNLVLSAFPRSMKLPDPLTPNLKVDLLPEIRDTPRIRSYLEPLFLSSLKLKMDLYIKNPREHPNFLSELLQNLKFSSPEEIERNSTKFNIPLFHSLVLAAGPSVIPESSPTSSPSPPHSSSLPPMEIFKYLCLNLEPEGRYYLLNSIANQLRYPNSHTYYYSCVMLYLFAEAPSEIIQEQITRVLVERLVPHRPHPWGLLITFIELMKNNRYNFWTRSFPKCAPEIERLFLHVGKSIAQTTQQ
uniref:CCR4-Not complex component Not1 C-terminal domain-containing protein n=1 Tax=Arcella intermedia TaxID=1963864 RepID=A0A6B2KWF0_9EUKA